MAEILSFILGEGRGMEKQHRNIGSRRQSQRERQIGLEKDKIRYRTKGEISEIE